ncbi:MAG: hypothetical protein HOV94_21410, partial [Saccharothrix sp.]|nr:hypothetical protein [Saccharothrix sp.]
MADLSDAHRAVRRRAAELDAAGTALVEATDELTRRRRDREAAARAADPRDSDAAARLAELDAAVADAEKTVEDLRLRRTKHREVLAEAVAEFGAMADPTEETGRLDSETPLLLLPVRIETRFAGDELWVRVYPDDWAVDTFEPRLSDGEVEGARRFWAAIFRAGGDEDLRRAAWRAIVASHGSGRSGWIIEKHAPLNPDDEPVRATPDEVILAVAGDLALSTADTTALSTYWTGFWRADGDPDGTLAEALRTAVGDERAAALIALPPMAVDDDYPGVDREKAPVRVAYCQLPVVAVTKTTSWTTPPRAKVLPDRLVLLGYLGGAEVLRVLGEPVPPALAVGPDPAAGPAEAFRVEDGELVVPDELAWMVDFDEAVRVGLGFRVALDKPLRGGFERLLVLGLRVAATPDEDQTELEVLLTNHGRGRKGLSLLPQGTPTNNTEGDRAGHDRLDDPDQTYPLHLGGGAGLGDTDSWDDKQDGQWLAECLGIDPAAFARAAGAAGTDQAEARAMNTALWPATLGYFLDTMTHPLLDDATVTDVRRFFLDYVSGRGRVPALRIGRQPYGILPTTALSRLSFRDDTRTGLQRVLDGIAKDWTPLAAAVPHVNGGGDPHQTLLDVVASHPASVEFHQRYAEAIEDIFNRLTFDDLAGDLLVIWQAFGAVLAGRSLLAGLGDTGPDTPDILGKIFHSKQNRLKGPVVDDRPLSEQDTVRPYCDDGRNYLHWLTDAAMTSLDTLRREDGFTGDTAPTALLYLLLRHALLLSWWDAGVRFRRDASLLDDTAFLASRAEPAFVHITGDGPTESRWGALYDTATKITGDERLLLSDAIPHLLDRPPARHLTEVIEAIRRLAGLPTARLERLLAEHLDCCSHRLDAWRLGLVHERLTDLRRLRPGDTPRHGVHLGVFGWLEEVRPEPRHLEPVELPKEVEPAFAKEGDRPLVRDSANGGFVHAPSLNHAATAAVLRSGFLANATPAHPDTMALNMSSARMRVAVSILQGVRGGQPLGALLGYRFERGLHDRHRLAEVDSFIFPLRKAFPAPGDRDGRHAVDGLALARHILATGQRNYPFGRAGLPVAQAAQQNALDAEADLLLDAHDAVADLVLAEGVHQAVLGNVDRVAATLDTASGSGLPTEPAVLETPHNGITVTHRFGLHLRTGLDHTASPVAGMDPSPRAMAEPAVNEFVAAVLPDPATVVATVTWTDASGTERSRLVTQQQLGLQPIDLLHVLRLESTSALGELDERILWRVVTDEGLPPDVTPVVRFTRQAPGHTTFFEIASLVGHLRALLTRSRPLRPTDVLPAGEARTGVDPASVHADRARAAAVRTALADHRDTLAALAD